MGRFAAVAVLLALAAAPASASTSGHEALYEAYSELRCLAQQLKVPLDSPTVIVVGRQTDGKSALLEALMGFQFNHVGGGTKTRRPIALQMQYDASREEPACYLHTADGERSLTLPQLQAHIEHENQRLDAAGTFEEEEIVVRIEYKYCPNLSIVDTPGLIGTAADDDVAADADGPEGARARAKASAVEALVLAKIAPADSIVLCVEECSSWDLAPARAVVTRVDEGLCRTVLVSTKLDTKFAQFGTPPELRGFLVASSLRQRHPTLLGGPYFTSVPAGRVGGEGGHQFGSNAAFQKALGQQEAADVQYIKAVSPEADAAGFVSSIVPSIGVSRLKHFLEEQLRARYLRSIGTIVPQLQAADLSISAEMRSVDASLADLSVTRTHEALRGCVSKVVDAIELAVKGSTSPAARALGQTLAAERAESKAPFALAGVWPQGAVRDADVALFGGAQYYRLIEEFRTAVRELPMPTPTPEEVTNAMGLGAADDVAHVGRSAAALSLAKSADQLRPLLKQLGTRLKYVACRMLLFVEDAVAPAGASAARRDEPAIVMLAGPHLWAVLECAARELIHERADAALDACEHELRDATDNPYLSVLGCGPLLRAEGVRPPRGPRGAANSAQTSKLPADADQLVGDALVRHLVGEWRQRFTESVVRKVHSLFLLALLEGLSARLASSTQSGGDPDSALGLEQARQRLQARRDRLAVEQRRVLGTLQKFSSLKRVYASK